VVVAGYQDVFAFAYYWPDQPTFSPTDYPTAVVFQVDYPGSADVMVCHENTQAGVDMCLRRAAANAHRIWLITGGANRRRWEEATKALPSARMAPSPRSPRLIDLEGDRASATG
jgi:hypothetical protein